MHIRELARRAHVTAPTIRYYEKIGVLPQPPRADNGYRIYREDDLERLRFVTRARSLDFSLDEIREILAFRERGEAPCTYVLSRIDEKVQEIDRRMAALSQLKQELQQLRDQAEGLQLTLVKSDACVCQLIENR
jgi:DNA-binding transcriptional MerR regulator